MDRWPYQVDAYTSLEVQQFCVFDESWQKFRLSLKGLPTEHKLNRLHEYREGIMLYNSAHMGEAYLPRRHQVQIDNYINALKRGGQLDMNLEVRYGHL